MSGNREAPEGLSRSRSMKFKVLFGRLGPGPSGGFSGLLILVHTVVASVMKSGG